VTLIPSREDPSGEVKPIYQPMPFDATKLPKPPSR
jgi:hypothetical protein